MDMDHDRLVDLLHAFSPVPPEWVMRAQDIALLVAPAAGDADGDHGSGSDGEDDADPDDAVGLIASDLDSFGQADDDSANANDADDPSGDDWLA